ncbi:tetratricopeptide repeat protein [Amycolatopsis sp. Hca4]|uniref:tetratricopeptide repeat protein n=1 Tax=Amycolatopsis sp. Hca4 TaxID=2742131 RepID=UPI001590D262|nr:tetratricopeptide repeat protein [Amycolatopsis sp. Hca4]QKV78829.1 tetratricopeptide repeat protein [Amycolatopsis sp. Hca4]
MVTTTGESFPLPISIEDTDVDQLEAAVGVLRALDYRQGGGFCRDAVRVVKTASLLLHWGTVPQPLRARLSTVLADVHNLLGWTEFDIGRDEAARRRFERALEIAAEAGNDNLVANIRYRLGRVHLHRHDARGALAEFARGREAAVRSDSGRALAILAANEAWAFAMAGDERPALTRLAEAEAAFATAGSWPEPRPWEAFFRETDMAAMHGTVLTELATAVAGRYSGEAITQLTSAAGGYGADMARSRSLTLVMLAQNHALRGDFDEATRIGGEAVDLAAQVGSVRPKDRLAPLERLLTAHRGDAAVSGLADRIGRYRSEPLG